jgi:hypothetical protein
MSYWLDFFEVMASRAFRIAGSLLWYVDTKWSSNSACFLNSKQVSKAADCFAMAFWDADFPI